MGGTGAGGAGESGTGGDGKGVLGVGEETTMKRTFGKGTKYTELDVANYGVKELSETVEVEVLDEDDDGSVAAILPSGLMVQIFA